MKSNGLTTAAFFSISDWSSILSYSERPNQHNRSPEEARLLIREYFDYLFLMLSNRPKTFVYNWIHKHLNFLDENWHVYENLNLQIIQDDLSKIDKTLSAVKTINNTSFTALLILADFETAKLTLSEGSSHLREYKENICEYETFILSTKGPKINLLQAYVASNLLKSFTPIFQKTVPFEITPIFEDCFISTKRNNKTSKASPLKMTVLALNTLGYKISQRQLHELLLRYNKLDAKFKTDRFIKNCSAYLMFREFDL